MNGILIFYWSTLSTIPERTDRKRVLEKYEFFHLLLAKLEIE